jgi:hypothetical protein
VCGRYLDAGIEDAAPPEPPLRDNAGYKEHFEGMELEPATTSPDSFSFTDIL